MQIRKKTSSHGAFRRARVHACAMGCLVVLAAACGSAQGEGTPPGGGGAEGGQEPSAPAPRSTDSSTQEARPPRGSAWVIFGSDTVVAEVARTPDERAQGLMYREELAAGTGMLFVFDNNEIRSFWMSNTYLPLDIAYMDPSFTVIDIQPMDPLTTTPHESAGPAMFALEVPQGWFADHGIAVGAQARVVFGVQ